MWPWILQDWEGSRGSFYDQPAAWTGAGGTWLVWDFFPDTRRNQGASMSMAEEHR